MRPLCSYYTIKNEFWWKIADRFCEIWYNGGMDWDEQYWLDSEAEEMNVREKARRMGIPRDEIDALIRRHPDAFEISDSDLQQLK